MSEGQLGTGGFATSAADGISGHCFSPGPFLVQCPPAPRGFASTHRTAWGPLPHQLSSARQRAGPDVALQKEVFCHRPVLPEGHNPGRALRNRLRSALHPMRGSSSTAFTLVSFAVSHPQVDGRPPPKGPPEPQPPHRTAAEADAPPPPARSAPDGGRAANGPPRSSLQAKAHRRQGARAARPVPAR